MGSHCSKECLVFEGYLRAAAVFVITAPLLCLPACFFNHSTKACRATPCRWLNRRPDWPWVSCQTISALALIKLEVSGSKKSTVKK